MGDDALRKISKVLNDSLARDDDHCFRLGGEEFGGVFKTASSSATLRFVERVKQNIEDLKIEHSTSTCSPYVTASIGLICMDIAGSGDADEYYKSADDLLYKAKAEGRNVVISNIST
jgi:diguanylate cyclase (GGDEF)-like protein